MPAIVYLVRARLAMRPITNGAPQPLAGFGKVLSGDDLADHKPLQHPPHECQRRVPVPRSSEKEVESLAVLIDRAPKIARLARGLHSLLFEVPTSLLHLT
jgi:hypothetical protein